MAKRSDFEREPRDFYPTPVEAVEPLFPHIVQYTKFIEPCAGDGRLIRHLQGRGHECVYACDIEPQGQKIEKRDVLFFDKPLPPCDAIITYPPWSRESLHAMIDIFRVQAPTFLLFDADWCHTIQAKPFLPFCRKIISIGRVKWIEDSDSSGVDNACWYEFGKDYAQQTVFIGRK